MSDSVRDSVLEAMEASLEAQLRAIRRLRKEGAAEPEPKGRRRTSHLDMVEDVLNEAGKPLHIREILAQIERKFTLKLDPDSLGSALTKRVLKKERFQRVQKNTFALLEEGDAG